MPEREVAVYSADEGQQARNSCPELRIFFLLASHGVLFFYMYGAFINTAKNVALNGQSTMRPFQDGPTAEKKRQPYCMHPDYRIHSASLQIRTTGSAQTGTAFTS